jgi:hypothetical protein
MMIPITFWNSPAPGLLMIISAGFVFLLVALCALGSGRR